jgi:transposase
MGHLTMSSKEARRPGLVQAALAGKISNREGAGALELSVRQFRRLKAAYRRAGVEGLIHGNRGRPSPRRLARAEQERIVELINQRYAGLNDCHLTEKLRECEQLEVSRSTVRRLRRAAGRPAVQRRRPPRHRARRLREAHVGAMVLVDGSEFAWLGPTSPTLSLLGAIDDATGKILALHFRPHEDLHGYTELLRRLIVAHGLPCNLYGDRLAVFVRNDPHWTLEEELAGVRHRTQFGQMLAELAIGFIAAQSPQAKGRIERLWRTLQDRLVAELRLRGLTTVEAAEAFLPEFIADFNRRFAHAAREAGSAWRPAPRSLARILACRYRRTVARDNTVSLPGRWIQLPPRGRGGSWQGRHVEVRERLDGGLQVFHEDQLIAEQSWSGPAFTLAPRKEVRRRRQLAIDLHKPAKNDDRLEPRLRGRARKTGIGHYTNVRRPKGSHPWKRRAINPPSRAVGAGGHNH